MANKHPRVNIHQPGPGVGGHCLAVDPYFIVAKSPDLAKIINLSRETNTSMPEYIVESVKMLTNNIQSPKIAVFGLAYKGNVDDLRESPAIEVVELLKDEKNIEVACHDPHVQPGKMSVVSAEEAVRDAHLVLVLTDHQEFKDMDFNALANKMEQKMVFDTRNCISQEQNSEVQVVNLGNIHEYKLSEQAKNIVHAH
jgi:UDP-N-acetyl-D-mannosaminuronic acid dehydrogenase